MAVVRFPGVTRRVPIGGLRCEGCGAGCFVFADTVPVRAWCSPWCAAEAGVAPWAAASAADRGAWPAPGEMGPASAASAAGGAA